MRLDSSNCLDEDDEVKTARIQNNLIINRGNIMMQQFSLDSAASPLLKYDSVLSPYKTAKNAEGKGGQGTAQKEGVLGAITYSPNANRHPDKLGEYSDSQQSPTIIGNEGEVKNVQVSPSPTRGIRRKDKENSPDASPVHLKQRASPELSQSPCSKISKLYNLKNVDSHNPYN